MYYLSTHIEATYHIEYSKIYDEIMKCKIRKLARDYNNTWSGKRLHIPLWQAILLLWSLTSIANLKLLDQKIYCLCYNFFIFDKMAYNNVKSVNKIYFVSIKIMKIKIYYETLQSNSKNIMVSLIWRHQFVDCGKFKYVPTSFIGFDPVPLGTVHIAATIRLLQQTIRQPTNIKHTKILTFEVRARYVQILIYFLYVAYFCYSGWFLVC